MEEIEQMKFTAPAIVGAFHLRKMIQIYEPIREKFTRRKRHKRITREALEWAIAIGLGCSIVGRWIGARLIDIGCIIEQFFLPLLKRFWHMAMELSTRIHWG